MPNKLIKKQVAGNELRKKLLVAAIALLGAGLWYRRRMARDRLRQVLDEIGYARLDGLVIPNGDDGEIQIDFLLLTSQGLLILHIKDVQGTVFGSDKMQDWTVISNERRFTFGNPQYALYDRLAAIRRLVTNVPVSGYVAFTTRSQFSKGQPSDVIAMDALLALLTEQCAEEDRAQLEQWRPHWDSLRETAVATQVGHLLKH